MRHFVRETIPAITRGMFTVAEIRPTYATTQTTTQGDRTLTPTGKNLVS